MRLKSFIVTAWSSRQRRCSCGVYVCVCLCLVVTRNLVHLWTGWLAQTTFDTLRQYGLVTPREQVLSLVTAVDSDLELWNSKDSELCKGRTRRSSKQGRLRLEVVQLRMLAAGVIGKPVPVWPGNLPKFEVSFLESGPERLSSLATSWMRCQKLVKQISPVEGWEVLCRTPWEWLLIKDIPGLQLWGVLLNNPGVSVGLVVVEQWRVLENRGFPNGATFFGKICKTWCGKFGCKFLLQLTWFSQGRHRI